MENPTTQQRESGPSEPMIELGGKELPVSQVEGTVQSQGAWFYWIAGLSIVNTIVAQFGGEWGMIVGLGTTMVFDAIGAVLLETTVEGAAVGTNLMVRALLLLPTLAVLGVFLFFGFHAKKARVWAFVIGMMLYAADGLLFIVVGDWLAFGFHAFVLVNLFLGANAARVLNRYWRSLPVPLASANPESPTDLGSGAPPPLHP